jgi:hypothetical protein
MENPKVKITHETPSEQIIKAANQVITVTDARNRQIGIKKMGPLDRMKLFEVCGPENSKNEAYLGYASLAFCVSSIDGDAQPRPSNRLQLEGLISRLDDDGLTAVAAGVAEHFAPKGDE